MQNYSYEQYTKLHRRGRSQSSQQHHLGCDGKDSDHYESEYLRKLNKIVQYWLFDIAMEGIVQSKDLQKEKTNPNDGPNRNTVFGFKIDEPKYWENYLMIWLEA